MANLIPVSRFDDVVALEKGDPIIGAMLGMSNKQAQQLLNRLTYINDNSKSTMDSLHSDSIDRIDDKYSDARELVTRMENIETKSDVVDVVASYTDIVNYTTSTLNENDIVKCLSDQTHGGIATYYRWINNAFSFIGAEYKSVPITVLASKSVTPVRNVTYVISGTNITLTLGTGSYNGLAVCIGTMSNGTNNVITSDASFTLNSNTWLKLTWNGSKWCANIPPESLDNTYPVGTVIMSTENISSKMNGTWTQISTGSILITSGQSYTAGTVYGSDNVNVTVTGSVGSTTLTAAQCPAHYHSANNSAATITVAAASSGGHTHSLSKPWGDGSSTAWEGPGHQGVASTYYTAYATHTHSATSGSVSSVGSGGAHSHTLSSSDISVSVVQSYINLYMFRRTA